MSEVRVVQSLHEESQRVARHGSVLGEEAFGDSSEIEEVAVGRDFLNSDFNLSFSSDGTYRQLYFRKFDTSIESSSAILKV